MKDYYKTLGVEKNASKDDIKKAFRTLAHKHHPDKGGDEQKFKEINEAYSVLSDDSKRAQYDRFGTAGPGAGGFGGGQGFDGFDFSQFSQGFGGGGAQFEFDLGDIFGEFFGGAAKSGRKKKGADISIDIELSFEEAVFGTEKTVKIHKTSVCEECQGTGAEKNSGTTTCHRCNGKGSFKEVKKTFFGQFETNTLCEVCAGSGSIPKVPCKTCKGAKVHKKEHHIKLTIPAGIDDGEMMRLSGAGEAIASGVSGDLYIKIHVLKHSFYRREGQHLVAVLSIQLSEALLGSTRGVKTLDGDITVSIPAGITHGEILKIKGKGVPVDKHRRGDILLHVHIAIPKKLSKEARKAAEMLQKEGL